MTSRERFHETLAYGKPDRVPLFDEGLRDDVLERWQEQGMPAGTDLHDLFGMDQRERIPVDLDPRPRMEDWKPDAAGVKALRRHLDPEDPSRWPDDWDEKVRAWRDRDHVPPVLSTALEIQPGGHVRGA